MNPTTKEQFFNKVSNNKYKILGQIGTGGYGIVLYATLLAPPKNGENRQFFAMKLCSLQSSCQRQTYENELLFSQILDNSNLIVRLVEDFTFKFGGEEFGVLCYEKLDMDLMDYIMKKGSLSEIETKVIFRSICKSLAYCHSSQIAHLDIKPENILLQFNSTSSSTSSIPDTVKLCDFGFTQKFKVDCKVTLGTGKTIGTKEYRAPEIKVSPNQHPHHHHQKKKFLGLLKPATLLHYSKTVSFSPDKADIYSLGVTLFVMITGFFPYLEDCDSNNLKIDYNNMKILKDLCDDQEGHHCYQLVMSMLDPNPKKRPSINDILHHPWLSNVNYLDAQYLQKLIQIEEEDSDCSDDDGDDGDSVDAINDNDDDRKKSNSSNGLVSCHDEIGDDDDDIVNNEINQLSTDRSKQKAIISEHRSKQSQSQHHQHHHQPHDVHHNQNRPKKTKKHKSFQSPENNDVIFHANHHMKRVCKSGNYHSHHSAQPITLFPLIDGDGSNIKMIDITHTSNDHLSNHHHQNGDSVHFIDEQNIKSKKDVKMKNNSALSSSLSSSLSSVRNDGDVIDCCDDENDTDDDDDDDDDCDINVVFKHRRRISAVYARNNLAKPFLYKFISSLKTTM